MFWKDTPLTGIADGINEFSKFAEAQSDGDTIKQKDAQHKTITPYVKAYTDFEEKNNRKPTEDENNIIISKIRQQFKIKINPALKNIPKSGKRMYDKTTGQEYISYPDGTGEWVGEE